MKRTLFFLVGMAAVPLWAHADPLYVQSLKAKIMSEPNFKSAEVASASRGDLLDAKETKDGWYRVTAGAKTGWVNRLCVAPTPPMERVTAIAADAADISEKSRKRASAITSAAAARGLSDAERKRMSEEGQADYRALMKLEQASREISDREVETFGAGE